MLDQVERDADEQGVVLAEATPQRLAQLGFAVLRRPLLSFGIGLDAPDVPELGRAVPISYVVAAAGHEVSVDIWVDARSKLDEEGDSTARLVRGA
jgi:hypothetical protein